jgi:hypothetical protein
MATTELSRLERVPLRTAWSNESLDFTPWLAHSDNLTLLAETLGLEIELEATEKDVGPFRADILCRDLTRDDAWVLIENQLERTDHTHLGQLITYAAGLNAATIVWIAEKICDEHRAALDWLNSITNEQFDFFGLEIELWRIGGSTPAPKFNVVCQPNNWQETLRNSRKPGTVDLTMAHQQQLEYWTELAEYLKSQSGFPAQIEPREHFDVRVASPFSGVQVRLFRNSSERRIGLELACRGTTGSDWYDQLLRAKPMLEKLWKTPVSNSTTGRGTMKLVIRCEDWDPNDRTSWPIQYEWFAAKLLVLWAQIPVELAKYLAEHPSEPAVLPVGAAS